MKSKPNQREEMQVTQMMHEKLREELKHNDTDIILSIKSLEKNMNANFIEVEAQFKRVDARFEKMEMMQTKFYAEIVKMNAVNARTLALVEEQRAENKTIWDKQAQLEEKLDSTLDK